MTTAPISEYSMMNGYKYGAESCTMVPMMLMRPQLRFVLGLGVPRSACGNSASRFSNDSSEAVSLCERPE